MFPNKAVSNYSVFDNIFCAGIQKKHGVINFASKSYNPYKTKNVALVWSEVTEDELYEKLKKVSPYSHEIIKKEIEIESAELNKS